MKKPPQFYRRFDYDRALLPNARLRELEEGVNDLEAAKLRTGWTIGYPGWGLIYHALLNHLDWDRPNIVIETGSNLGCSTIVLAQAVKDCPGGGHVHTIEIDAECMAKAEENVAAAGLSDFVTLHRGDSLETLPGVLAGVDEVRVAFLDGAHYEAHALGEFELVLPKLSPTGIVLFDNTFGIREGEKDERVFGALKKIRARHGGNLVNFERTSWNTPGLAIWQR
ncbi:MAG: class I SAM-dependent methyltransferase [Terricaulis sp.]|nr:class I SAM-dependent methyltransferase [Terricaulis sp.]